MEQSIFLKSKNMKDLSICVCVNLFYLKNIYM